MNKHAFLIMVHDDFYTFEKLICLLDNKINDLYIHVDKKVKNFDKDKYKNLIKESSIIFIDRMDVRWGSILQINCTIKLLNEALKTHHSYYHFISGVDLPIKTNYYIHTFCDNSGMDFVDFSSFDKIDDMYVDRIKYYQLFDKQWRNKNEKIARIAKSIRFRFCIIQKKFKINRLRNSNMVFRKGANRFSITEKTATYIVNQTKILRYFKHSYCADELFIQTIIYNSKYKDNIYLEKNNKTNSFRYVDWNKGNPAIIKEEDYNDVIKSNNLFARKFNSQVDKKVIDRIYNELKKV